MIWAPGVYNQLGLPVSLDEWAEGFEDWAGRIVQRSRHKERGREFVLSTVFVGIDMAFGEGEPLIYETMVFEIEASWRDVVGVVADGQECQRWSSLEDARAGHDPWAMTAP